MAYKFTKRFGIMDENNCGKSILVCSIPHHGAKKSWYSG